MVPANHHADLDRVIHFKTVDSTNLEARRLRSKFTGETILIVSDEQMAGMGQHGRTWSSQAGKGLWMTLLIGRPAHLKFNLQLLSLYTGIVMRKTLSELTGIPIKLKWPNDIMMGDLKCGGILSEIHWMGSTAKSAILGIGINLKHTSDDFPPKIRHSATSVRIARGKRIKRAQLIDNFTVAFFENIQLLDHSADLTMEWNSNAYKFNQIVRWNDGGKIIEGEFLGVDRGGAAQIGVAGQVSSHQVGEIQMDKAGG